MTQDSYCKPKYARHLGDRPSLVDTCPFLPSTVVWHGDDLDRPLDDDARPAPSPGISVILFIRRKTRWGAFGGRLPDLPGP
jgi:hypothetical protein